MKIYGQAMVLSQLNSQPIEVRLQNRLTTDYAKEPNQTVHLNDALKTPISNRTCFETLCPRKRCNLPMLKFVSQTNMHEQLSSGARGLKFGPGLHLHSYFYFVCVHELWPEFWSEFYSTIKLGVWDEKQC